MSRKQKRRSNNRLVLALYPTYQDRAQQIEITTPTDDVIVIRYVRPEAEGDGVKIAIEADRAYSITRVPLDREVIDDARWEYLDRLQREKPR